jgi:hypothetical protein
MASSAPTRPNPNTPKSQVITMPPRGKKRRHWPWVLAVFIMMAVAIGLGIRHVIKRAEPILRTRVIETLSARFKSKVELAELHVSVSHGLGVDGKGLKIFGLTDPNPTAPGVQPLLSIDEFSFGTGVRSLFRSPIHVATVYVKGMTMNLPPKEDRGQLNDMRGPQDEDEQTGKTKKNRISIIVDEFVCENTQLIINTHKPGKEPLDFQISHLKMKDLGPGQAMPFDATLVNPKPVGDIQSTGHFGPLHEEEPRDTPVDGEYSFTNADLGTLKGIAGILSSTGKYQGSLGRIEVNGKTDTPDFRIAISGHPVPLHTEFHAIVDGTDGDTYLQPVSAHFLHTWFTAKGKVVRVKGHGHDIELDVVMNRARIEDLLQLGVKTDPPVMSGDVTMQTKMSLPPGQQEVAQKLKLDGHFKIINGQFSNDKIQDRIDSLSLRSQGKPKMAQEHVDVNVPSELNGTFTLDQGLFNFSVLHFNIPGTDADITGQYSLDGNTFDFHGKLKMDAKLSQMTTGWKSLLLKPVDHFFKKDGAGTEIPFKVSGTKSEPHFGLDLHHKDGDDKENGKDAEPKPNPDSAKTE